MNPRIFSVDDFSLTHRHIKKALANKEYELHRCMSAKECLQLLSEKTPDLFLIDIEMPEIGGFELCQKLKRNTKTENIPVIFLSAKSSEGSRREALLNGGNGFVSKPFYPQELIEEVEKVLAN